MNHIFNIPFKKLYEYKRMFDYAESNEGHRNNLSFKRECKKKSPQTIKKTIKKRRKDIRRLLKNQ